MRDNDIINKICHCATLYQQHLVNKNYMIIYNVVSEAANLTPDMIETVFFAQSFLHLTGVLTPLKPIKFYERSRDSRLKRSDFTTPSNGVHVQKLSVLHELVCPHIYCKMIGGFNGNGFYLETSRVMGNVRGAMGFRIPEQAPQFYVPNTVLQGDVRDRVVKPYRILAMLRKKIKDVLYADICYLAKGVELCELEPFLINTGKCARQLQIV